MGRLSRFALMGVFLGGFMLMNMNSAEFHISPTGDDKNPGTKAKPFRTLEAARDAIRKNKGTLVGGVNVFLRGGIYERDTSFALGKEDSGTEGAPITYASAPGEIAILTGGRVLKPEWFTKVTNPAVLKRIIDEQAHAKILQVDLSKHGITEFGEISRHGFNTSREWGDKVPPLELFMNGKRLHRARWPNKGQAMVHMSGVRDKGPVRPREKGASMKEYMARGGTFSYRFSRPGLWEAEKDIWIDGVLSQDWAWTYNKVAAVDTKKKTITLRYGEVYGIMKMAPKQKKPLQQGKKNEKRGKAKPRDFFFVDNVLAELDAPGEYYLDRDSGILYVIPPEPLKPSVAITVSMLKTPMIELKEASHITFENIILEGGRGSAIACTDGVANRFSFCEVRNFGGAGIAIKGNENKVASCHVHHIGGSAIALDGGYFETLSPGNNAVENCHIHDWGVRDKVYTSGVGLRGVGNRVSHCHIHSAPHSGLVVGGNDHVIEYNEINDILRDFHDMGAIYMNLGSKPLCRGQVIRRNFFHHFGRAGGVNAVYPDNGTMGVLVEENVFYKLGPGEFSHVRAIGGNGFAYVIVRNNMFIDCEIVMDQSYYLNTWGRKKHLPSFEKKWKQVFADHDVKAMPHGKKYPELLRFFKEDRVFPAGNRFERNLVFNPAVERAHDDAFMTRGGPKEHIKSSDNWIAEGDPGFVDLKKMDFRLKRDAPALSKIKGFRPIPFEKIGLHGPVGPKAKQRVKEK